ncbi:hypothetical protein ACE1OE_00785 [Vibrio sp. E150_011]
MSTLETHLQTFNVAQMSVVADQAALFSELCARENALFERAQTNKPDTPILGLLLGLFTKLNVESIASLQTYSSQVLAMRKSFEDELGKDEAQVFKLPVLEELVLVTHVWLYIQGCLGMDYSLANDHADQTSQVIAAFNGNNVDETRIAFTKSYYLGFRYFEANKPPATGWKRWFEKWFN